MKKIIIILIFVVAAFLIYSSMFRTKENTDTQIYAFDVEDIDRDLWFVGQWETFSPAFDWVTVNDGVFKMTGNGNQTPYLLTKPIAFRPGDVITLKRRVKITHGTTRFAGGMAMYQTDETEIIPEASDGNWSTSFGDGVALIEYSYDLSTNQTRPGKDVIRFLAADWEYNDNYQLISPKYDEWVDEVFVFDTRSSQISYTFNGSTTYRLNSYKLDGSNIRFLMHAYGDGSGNSVEIAQMEITVENKASRLSN